MRRSGGAFLFLVLGIAASIPSGAGAQTPPAAPSFLYVQQASSGRAERHTDGSYTLELHVQPRVTAFSERPLRVAATEPVQQFVHEWAAAGLDKDPPNAALALSDAPARRDTFAFTLTKPRYDARSGTLRYHAVLLHDLASARLATFAKDLDRRPPAHFDAASVFIDAASAPGSYAEDLALDLPIGTTQVSVTPTSKECATDATDVTNAPYPDGGFEASFTAINSGACFFKKSSVTWDVSFPFTPETFGPTTVVTATVSYSGTRGTGYTASCQIAPDTGLQCYVNTSPEYVLINTPDAAGTR